MAESVNIANHSVGPGHPCLIIAEAGVNHNGDTEMALRLVGAAADAKADVVKFQTFKGEKLASAEAPKAAYQLQQTDQEESQQEMLRRLELTPAMHEAIRERCNERGVVFASTPFEEHSADYLNEFGMAFFKIPSGEVNNFPFLEHVAKMGKPIILSTGMSSMDEVKAAVEAIRSAGNDDLVLLHCVSNYPADPTDANLLAMKTMTETFDLPVGFSDHTMGMEVSFAAVALGASVIEKHFTLDRTLPGPDHKASLEPEELASWVAGIRKIESALGDGRKRVVANEANTLKVIRKSLVAARDIESGAIIEADMIMTDAAAEFGVD
ncbi:N-acetylneuraminate synthase, partial [Candidatus Hydrogenedentota bacterium]